MDHFRYVDGALRCESVEMPSIAEEFGTPLYVYSKATLLDHYERMAAAFEPLNPTICYSIKSCHNLTILKLLNAAGSAFDIVSGGELSRALEAGVDASRAVFAGVGKTDAELRDAITVGIAWFNVESEQELDNLATIAASMDKVASAALRVNPDVDPKTHVYTTTGTRETKFGVDLERARAVFDAFRGRSGLDLAAIHVHLGSPVNTIEPYVESIQKTLALIDQLRADGHAIRALNIGGGFGAHYEGSEAPAAAEYARAIVPLLAEQGLEILMEPGRSIAANAGVLLTRVLYTKASGDREFVIVDAAMTELLRPALYGAFHFAWPVAPALGQVPGSRSIDEKPERSQLVDIVGPVCESGDFLAKDRHLPPVSRGDLICIFSAGAYGSVMGSQYNSRCRPAEVLVDGTTCRLIRRRETYDDLVATERVGGA